MIVLKARQEKVLAALQAVAGIVERRHTLAILANVLIRKSGEQIELTASDLDIQVRTRVALGGADTGDFATTVSARKLIDILRAMPADQLVTLTASASKVTLQGGRSRFTLQTLPPEDFPLVVQAPDLGPAFSVPQSVLNGLIEQVEFAMAVQDIRYFLNGVLFIAEGKSLRLVATDGNRLALAESSVDVEMPKQQVILPRKAVHELQRHLRERGARRDDQATEPLVEMRFSASQARFGLNGTEFITKLIEGRFPDFDRVIPKRNPHAVTLGRAPFLESLQRASILTSERFRGIRVSLAPGGLRIASSNAEREEADEDLEIDYGGDSIEIGFNVTYLLDVLGKTDVDMVKMELQDASSSVLFTFPDRAGFKYVVSPMRL
jgi:DNA polymerase-3 subunit beta